MQTMIFSFISFLISAAGFGFGVSKLFKKKKPLYLKIIVCATGCFAFEQLSLAVNILCGISSDFSISMLGIFGCNFFLLSANFGTIDKIVDDGQTSHRARKLAVIAPIISAVLTAVSFLLWKDRDMLSAVVWVIALLPTVPASYFNLKHILLPMDPFEILGATKSINFASLVFYGIGFSLVLFKSADNGFLAEVFSVILSVSSLSLVICAVKGAKKWGI